MGGVSTDVAVHPLNKFVYVTTADDYGGIKGTSNSVTAFSVASNGSLTPVPGSPFITGGPNWGIAIDPNGQYLYASSQVSDNNYAGLINAFSINQTTGALTPIPGSPFPVIPYTCQVCSTYENIFGMAIDPTGNYLIGGGWNNGVIYVYRIQAGTGSLSEVPGSPFIEMLPSAGFPSDLPTDVTVTPPDKYVLVDNNSACALVMYDFDSSSGALSNMTSVPLPYGTFCEVGESVRSDPSGKFVYTLGLVNSKQTKTGMIGYAIGSSGSVTIVPNAPYPDPISTSPNLDGIAVTP